MRFTTRNDSDREVGYFLSQPHQPFFLFGILWAVVAMLLFMLGYKGVLPMRTDPTLLHAYGMLFVVFTHFFHGFLLTTYPRFCMAQAVSVPVYLRIFGLYEAGAFLFFAGALFFAPLAWVGMALLFAGHVTAVRRFALIYKTGQSPEKSDPFWLLTAHGMGLGAHLLFLLGFAADLSGFSLDWRPWAVAAGVYLYLFFLTFVVAQRMIPFFSHVMADKSPRFIPVTLTALGLKALFFALGLPLFEAAVTAALAVYLLRTFLAWRLPVFTSPAILWVLHLGLFWLPAGLFVDAVLGTVKVSMQTDFVFGGMHLVALGFVTTILIGFGTRVTLGHSGQVPHADRLSTALFWFTQVVVLTRLLYSMAIGLGLNLAWLFDLSAMLWMILFMAWGWRFGPVLYRGKGKG